MDDVVIEGPPETYPLLMSHVIDITGAIPDASASASASTSTSTHDNTRVNSIDFGVPGGGGGGGSNGSNSRTRRRSSISSSSSNNNNSVLNSGLWICIEVILTVSQVVASVVVLSLSRHEHEHPRTPLFAWIVGYASGCVATLPLLAWRYYHNRNNRVREQDSSSQTSPSGTNGGGGENVPSSRSNRDSWLMNRRLKLLAEYLKIAIDCFFAIWFVVGNVWIFGGHSSADEAPNLYRLCVVFLTFNCICYAMPFILCATICCCLPCIISILGVRENLTQTQGATSDSINALPTYKFKVKKNKSRDESNSAVGEGGIVAAGTEKERMVSGEDAVCCICLAKYENNDELRELPCSHLFHKDCVDKWLKMNALCPLCKSEVGENVTGSVSGVDNGLASTSS
ncbi:E3 ubiquitin-protein ligase At1g63170-like [Gastrolobium bilobum]|uniref:E3 ubiquitin-protein ligase At1g63170-like n=1 Tax=Gastrolobium bilobum TaxID=150636 RepID=UPI002AAFC520|nr:E3 ubiquitin-protein ligase At1g63170-like [Gastrolobium bilobum]